MKDIVHVYAIIRIDTDIIDITNSITIKEIVPTIEEAEKEINRLNKLNGKKDCIYFWRTTRLKKKFLSDIKVDN